MHLCLTLQSKLEVLKNSIKKLEVIVEAVEKVASGDQFKAMKEKVKEQLKESTAELISQKTELEGLKLNFREELLKYLGADEADWTTETDSEGYLIIIGRRYYNKIILTESNPDLSQCSQLKKADFGYTNVKSPKLPTENFEKVDFRGCKNLEENPDLSQCSHLKKANFSFTKVKSPKLPTENMEEVSFNGCMHLEETYDLSQCFMLEKVGFSHTNVISPKLLTENLEEVDFSSCFDLEENYDLSQCSKLKKANFQSSSAKKILLSSKQFKRYKSGKLVIIKDDHQKIEVKS